MTKYLFLSLLIFSQSAFSGEWRTPHTSQNISDIRNTEANLNGNFIGLSGTVGEVSIGYKGKPIFQLLVADKAGKDTILVGSLIEVKLVAGDKVEIFGDVIPILDIDHIAKSLTTDTFMVLGLCIVNETQKYAKGEEDAGALCNKWYLKEFPTSY